MDKKMVHTEGSSAAQASPEDPRIDLAIERTELAMERTQLAWIRTTLAFLGSGIALDKGVEAIRQGRLESGNAFFEHAHMVGLSLSITGTVIMIYATWYFMKRLHALQLSKGMKPVLFPPAFASSILMIVLGLAVSFLLLVS
jgi:putative membrane protein